VRIHKANRFELPNSTTVEPINAAFLITKQNKTINYRPIIDQSVEAATECNIKS